MQHVGSYLPDQGLNPCPLHWKYGVLTTGPPGKFQARPCGGISDSSLPLTPRIPAISKSSPLSPSPPAACPRHRHLSPGCLSPVPLVPPYHSVSTQSQHSSSISQSTFLTYPKPCNDFLAKTSLHPARPSTGQPGSSPLPASSSFPSQAVLASLLLFSR